MVERSDMKKRFNNLGFWVLQLVIAYSVFANIPTDWYYGRTRDFTNARSLGLAGISTIIPSPSGMFINPALLGLIKNPSFDFSAALNWTSEKRTKELFDQFENTIGEISVADNMFTHTKVSPLAIAYPLPAFGGTRIGLGLGYTSVIDYNYYFHKELRDDYYQKIGDYELKATGQTQGINFATGVNLNNPSLADINIGAGLCYSWGNHQSTQESDSFQIKALNFNFGAVTGLGERLKIGFDFQNRWKMHWKPTAEQVNPPTFYYLWTSSFGLGATYNFPGEIPTIALTEFRYIYWQDRDHPSSGQNSLNIRAGIEHTMLNDVKLRYGFGVIPSLIKLTPPTVLISFGLGFSVESLKFDIGANIQRCTLTEENFYWPIDEEKVYETFGNIVISVSRSF